jgi:pantetheine-phosphate adenylyltransferase
MSLVPRDGAGGRRCVCPGSFDPVTAGHIDVIRRATTLFDEVVVAVLTNPVKVPLFGLAERIELLRASLSGLARVHVDAAHGGLLVDYCRQLGAVAVVKGLRSGSDFAYELPMALMNRHLTDLETVFLPGDPALAHVSSSLVKEVAAHGGDVSGLVPDVVLPVLMERLSRPIR